jgi:hypothetical protein
MLLSLPHGTYSAEGKDINHLARTRHGEKKSSGMMVECSSNFSELQYLIAALQNMTLPYIWH